MRTYKFHIFDTVHTLDQTLTGYDYSWAALVLFIFVSSILILSVPIEEKKAKKFTGWIALLWLATVVVAYFEWGIPQLTLFVLLSITFILSYLFDWKKPKPKSAKVCIIGSGISGLTAAYQLQKQGYTNVTVFEKEDRVGGKCYTPQEDWHPYDLGGHEMLAGYHDLVQIAKEIGAPTKTSVKPIVYDRKTNKYLGFKKAAIQSGNYTLLQVMWAALKYMYIVGIQFRRFSQPNTGFKNMPAELCCDLDKWLEKRNLMALSNILSFVIKAQGFGGYDKSTVAYLVKFMGFKNWFSLLIANMGISKKWPRVFSDGAQNFCQRLAATIPDVRLNVNIRKIERNNDEIQNGIKVYLEDQKEPLLYDWLIISTPLAPSGLGYLDIKKGDHDWDIFDQLKTYDVYMTLCEIQGLPTGVVAWLPLTTENLENAEPTGYIKDWANEPYAFFLALIKKGKTKADVTREIEAQLEKIPPYYGVQPKLIRVVVQKRWDYFPHIEDQKLLLDGYYDNLESLQGKKQTYYASSALSFECMGNCAGYAKRLVKKHF